MKAVSVSFESDHKLHAVSSFEYLMIAYDHMSYENW